MNIIDLPISYPYFTSPVHHQERRADEIRRPLLGRNDRIDGETPFALSRADERAVGRSLVAEANPDILPVQQVHTFSVE